MKHVRMPKFFLWVFAVCGTFFAGIGALMMICDAPKEACGMGLFALGCFAALLFARSCELEYDDQVVRRRRLIGWREVRIDEIDRVRRGEWADIYYAGKRRIRYDNWADDEGDLPGAILRSCGNRGQVLTVVSDRFSAFAERLYAGNLAKPGDYLIMQVITLAIVPGALAMLAIDKREALLNPQIWAFFGGMELLMMAVNGFLLYAVRHAEQHPLLARMAVKDWAWKRHSQGKRRRKKRS